MKRAKKQHWVSRFYLEHFAIPHTKKAYNPQVWAFSKTAGEPIKVGIRDFLAKNYLYSPINKQGQRDWSLENELAGLEDIISRRWDALANRYINLENEVTLRRILALFIATLHVRHPRQINILGSIHTKLVNYLDSIPKDASGNPAVHSIIDGKQEHLIDNTTYNDLKEQAPQEVFVSLIRPLSLSIVEVLMKKRWSIGYSAEPRFITSDNPVALLHPDRKNYGFDTKGTLIMFPLSPTRILLIDDKHDEPNYQYYPFDADAVTRTNYLTWYNSDSFMVSHRNTDEVCLEILAHIDAHKEQME